MGRVGSTLVGAVGVCSLAQRQLQAHHAIERGVSTLFDQFGDDAYRIARMRAAEDEAAPSSAQIATAETGTGFAQKSANG